MWCDGMVKIKLIISPNCPTMYFNTLSTTTGGDSTSRKEEPLVRKRLNRRQSSSHHPPDPFPLCLFWVEWLTGTPENQFTEGRQSWSNFSHYRHRRSYRGPQIQRLKLRLRPQYVRAHPSPQWFVCAFFDGVVEDYRGGLKNARHAYNEESPLRLQCHRQRKT